MYRVQVRKHFAHSSVGAEDGAEHFQVVAAQSFVHDVLVCDQTARVRLETEELVDAVLQPDLIVTSCDEQLLDDVIGRRVLQHAEDVVDIGRLEVGEAGTEFARTSCKMNDD